MFTVEKKKPTVLQIFVVFIFYGILDSQQITEKDFQVQHMVNLFSSSLCYNQTATWSSALGDPGLMVEVTTSLLYLEIHGEQYLVKVNPAYLVPVLPEPYNKSKKENCLRTFEDRSF